MKKVLVLSFVFVFMFSSLAHAMPYQEFMDKYPNEYIYRVDFPTGGHNYLSSPFELEFAMEDTFKGRKLESGKAFVIYKPVGSYGTVYRLRDNGEVHVWTERRLEIIDNPNVYVGYDEGVDIYRWNGYSFFLPEPLTFLRVLGGPIRTILLVGFGIVSLMLFVRLLTVYFRRYLLRSL